jgi:hypothetical protein
MVFIDYLKKHQPLVAIIILFFFLRLPSLFEPYWYGDEGIYLTIGQAINRGVVLYRGIHDNKPPTLYYLAALSQTVFGFRLLLSLWMIPTIYFFHQLAKKILSSKLSYLATFLFLILTSIPLLEGNIANAEIFMLLPTILAFLLMYRSHNWFTVISSGLLLGFAFTIKIPVFIEFCLLIVWLFLIISHFDPTKIKWASSIAKIVVFSLSFALPIVLFLLYFIYRHAVNEFLFSALLQNFGYLSSWSTGSHSGSATSGGLMTRGITLFLFWLFILILLIKKYITRELTFLIFWFSATIFGALLSTRPYPHYLIQILPPFSILIAYIFETSTAKKIKHFIIGIFFVFIILFVKYKFYVYPVFSYYRNFYTHIFNLSSSQYRQYFGPSVDSIYQISDFIDKNTSKQDMIFVWGDEPVIYAISNRLPAAKYTVAYHVSDFNQYQLVYDQLTVNFPKLIIYYPQPSRPFPKLDKFIDQFYIPVNSFGSAIIYQSL